jgi:hypothetical protein
VCQGGLHCEVGDGEAFGFGGGTKHACSWETPTAIRAALAAILNMCLQRNGERIIKMVLECPRYCPLFG